MYAFNLEKSRGSCRETQLLGRLITALNGCPVYLELSNGSRVVGYVASYKVRVRTANLKDSINDLRHSNREVVDSVYSSEVDGVYVRAKASSTHARRISSSPPSQIILHDVILFTGRESYKANRLEVQERHVMTLSPSAALSRQESVTATSTRTPPSALQLQRMILQQPCDSIKNAAFLRCSRIGQNNEK